MTAISSGGGGRPITGGLTRGKIRLRSTLLSGVAAFAGADLVLAVAGVGGIIGLSENDVAIPLAGSKKAKTASFFRKRPTKI
ncbi:hypothetical protein [Jannaschia aquimarina]|uniref:Uncharacterized protein n=1 Tax=Jannaschia aquimarina TaxID=935700 RepID=A0A0D1EHY9_9RHOB|nr:hypothetical protein [Jannaschia aquimarina]KIT15455.1 hypothetical protein jaqu_28890 [Jannaschia aquimarina]